MATRVQLRRGTTLEHSTFTGASAEITVNTDNNTVVVHDGVTAGGHELAPADLFYTATKSLTLTTDWQDVGIQGTDLPTGTYIIQLYANDVGSGGYNTDEYYSGTMSWYSGSTSSSMELPSDEIELHRAGGSSDAGVYLRTYRSNTVLKLQIYSNSDNASAANYVFKFRRMI